MQRPRQHGTGRSTCPKCRAVFRRRLQHCLLDGTPLDPLPQDPMVGSVIGERYRIEHVRSDGSTTRTYAARDEHDGDRCSVKMMYGDYASVASHRDRFVREIELGARLCHANVMAVIDAGHTEAGVPYLVTPRVRGQVLSSVIAHHAPLSAGRAIHLIAGVAAGLEHMHEHGVVHRGIGSTTIIVRADGESETAIIADLSTARTAAGAIDHREDLTAVGALLFELLSGRGGDAAPNAARVAGLRVDPLLRAIVTKLLRNDPNAGFHSARDLLAALGEPKLCLS